MLAAVVVILYELVLCLLWLKLTGSPKLKSLPQQQIQHCTCLRDLYIQDFDSVDALPSVWGNLASLTHLRIKVCENLVFLPAVEVMQSLTKLVTCPGLRDRSALLSDPEWHKISHIPCISGNYILKRNPSLFVQFPSHFSFLQY